MPGSPAWQSLAQQASLDFGDYGDWPEALINESDRPVVWLLFLQDLLAADANTSDAISAALLPLRQRLARQEFASPVIVAWSGWRANSHVWDARAPSPWRRAARELEDTLFELAARYPALHLVDLDAAFARIGHERAFDARNFYAARARLSSAGIRQAAQAIASVFERTMKPARKVLVLDCDNTLWGGVVGEAGLSGLQLGTDGIGRSFSDFQAAAAALARQGVLLALASKNNEQDVWEVFDRHPGMQLKRSDITAWRINWQDKARNIAALAEELSLGLDSFVFWDDNPLEREKLMHALPAVLTIGVPETPWTWPDMLREMDAFARFSVTADDLRKTEQYRERARFINDLAAAGDESSYLRSIAMRPEMLALDAATLPRAEQLCQKTNQFNLRTERHRAADLQKMTADPANTLFLVRLSDRFGDHGIVGLVIARGIGEVAFLDTLLLSCRVLGRHLEAWVLAQLAAKLRDAGYRWLIGEFRASERNAPAADFLATHGLDKWPDAPDLLPGRLREAAALAALEGEIYHADLTALLIPHMEIFDAAPEPR